MFSTDVETHNDEDEEVLPVMIFSGRSKSHSRGQLLEVVAVNVLVSEIESLILSAGSNEFNPNLLLDLDCITVFVGLEC
jgi:hypothetical protein